MRLFQSRPRTGQQQDIDFLQRLRVLEIMGSNLEWVWCLLPELRKLRLGHDCDLPHVEDD
jgi:hypothetical protein